jgi:hypothetical protein
MTACALCDEEFEDSELDEDYGYCEDCLEEVFGGSDSGDYDWKSDPDD